MSNWWDRRGWARSAAQLAEAEAAAAQLEAATGTSLLPVLKGETIPERPLVWHYPHYGNQGGTPGSGSLQDANASPRPSAATSGTVTVDVVTPPES